MIGPILLVVVAAVAGGLAGSWPGAAAGLGVGLLVVFGVMAAAAWWAAQIGRSLDPATAWSVAPRPPLFARLCDAVYRRSLGPRGEDPENP